MPALLAAFAAVLIAELGDKTQFVIVACAARYRWQTVLTALVLTTAVLTLIGAAAGGVIAAALPVFWVKAVAACAFLGCALWTAAQQEEQGPADRCGRGPFWTVVSFFFLAEMGDKTQLVTFSLAATASSDASGLSGVVSAILPVWAGATAGMVVADAAGLVAGLLLHRHLPLSALRWTASLLFAGFGIVTLREALAGFLVPERILVVVLVLVSAVVGLALWAIGRRRRASRERADR